MAVGTFYKYTYYFTQSSNYSTGWSESLIGRVEDWSSTTLLDAYMVQNIYKRLQLASGSVSLLALKKQALGPPKSRPVLVTGAVQSQTNLTANQSFSSMMLSCAGAVSTRNYRLAGLPAAYTIGNLVTTAFFTSSQLQAYMVALNNTTYNLTRDKTQPTYPIASITAATGTVVTQQAHGITMTSGPGGSAPHIVFSGVRDTAGFAVSGTYLVVAVPTTTSLVLYDYQHGVNSAAVGKIQLVVPLYDQVVNVVPNQEARLRKTGRPFGLLRAKKSRHRNYAQ